VRGGNPGRVSRHRKGSHSKKNIPAILKRKKESLSLCNGKREKTNKDIHFSFEHEAGGKEKERKRQQCYEEWPKRSYIELCFGWAKEGVIYYLSETEQAREYLILRNIAENAP